MEQTLLKKSTRNYEIDFMKLILAVSVFLYHARVFMEKSNPHYVVLDKLGWISVHLFFIISGYFMVCSYMKRKDSVSADDSGKNALTYVLGRIKPIIIPIYISIAVGFAVNCAVLKRDPLTVFIKSIPELLLINSSGLNPQELNTPLWYLSAMFICMLPLYYLLQKHTSFFIYVFSPLCAIILFSYCYTNGNGYLSRIDFTVFLGGALIHALCGLSFGVCAWVIVQYIKSSKAPKIVFTVIETLVIVLYTYMWIIDTVDITITFPIMLLFPLLLAIIASGKSYISLLFSSKLFSKCGSLSLAIYLMHFSPRRIVAGHKYFSDMRGRDKIICMAIITAVLCVLYYIIIFLINKLKSYLANRKQTVNT